MASNSIVYVSRICLSKHAVNNVYVYECVHAYVCVRVCKFLHTCEREFVSTCQHVCMCTNISKTCAHTGVNLIVLLYVCKWICGCQQA